MPDTITLFKQNPGDTFQVDRAAVGSSQRQTFLTSLQVQQLIAPSRVFGVPALSAGLPRDSMTIRGSAICWANISIPTCDSLQMPSPDVKTGTSSPKV